MIVCLWIILAWLGGASAAAGDVQGGRTSPPARIVEVSPRFSTAVLEVSEPDKLKGCGGEFFYTVTVNGQLREVVPARFVVLDLLDRTHVVVRITERKGNIHSSYGVRFHAQPGNEPLPRSPVPAAPFTAPLEGIPARATFEPLCRAFPDLLNPFPPPSPVHPENPAGTAGGAVAPAPVPVPALSEAMPLRDFLAGMVRVPGGTFSIGLPEIEGRFCNEGPVHTVSLEPYYLDRHEVSRALYARFLRETGRPAPPGWTGSAPPAGTEDLPVVNVSWDDAEAFARWAHKRLPSEEEWETAGRGPQAFLFPWGNDFREGMMNSRESGKYAPLPPGSLPGDRSAYGVEDLAGNVSEWTSSHYLPYPGNRHLLRDAYGIDSRVIRGGAFNVDWLYCRLVFRARQAETYAGEDLGFRCAISVSELDRLLRRGVLRAD